MRRSSSDLGWQVAEVAMVGKTVLVLGAGGNFGGAAAAALAAAGWQVSRYARGTDMGLAARGASLIVNGLNPPNYHAWARLIPEITASVLAAGRASGASILVPGNVYVFGTEPGPWGAATPHRPVARKGQVRAEMEARYHEAAGRGQKVVILRAGDFVAAGNAGTILNMVMLKAIARGRVTALGAPEVPHAWADLSDLGRATVALAEQLPALPAFNDIGFAGLTFSPADLAAEAARQLSRPVALKRFPWWALRLAAPVWELGRELLEMRYLYETPHSIDGGDFAHLLPGFSSKTLPQVVAEHLAARGLQGR
ncbi:MAG: epimerase [Phaeovulum sp.]|uniref:epimerase n=1 Tax=Phaeovulum sp. TaxID=2934796 RepID=UPI00272F730F|nr:epimerase [Phaeovulum sp.]MDP2061508.1 epimerase [Phaeovulum sp.]